MKRYIAILAAAVLAAACSEKSTDAGSGNFTVSVSATQTDVTRTVMNDGALGWTTSDALGIYADKIQQNKHFVINSACDRFYGAFVFTGSSYTSATYRAYYPYRSTSSGTVISATLPAVQNGPWDSSADFMVSEPLTAAYTEDPDKFPELDFRFKSSGHLFGIVKLTLQDGPKAELANESISFVQIKTGGTPLAGDFRFDVAKPENGASFTSSADSVRVVFSGGNAPSLASPVTVYAVVRPTLSPVTNMTVTVTTTGGTASFNSSQSVSIARGTIKELPPITVSEKWERLPSLNSRFTDAAFLAYMLENFDKNNDGFLVAGELQMVGSINCASLGISSLKGIELAENLVSLDCSGNSISSLDLSANAKLRDLNCSVPSLGTLDISGCTQLQTLDISGTAIPALDLSGCQSLQTLTANACGLKTLDLSGNLSVRTITVNNSATEKIILKGCTALSTVNCIADKLTQLDLGGCSSLYTLSCYDNTALDDINLSGCTTLNGIWCRQCALTSLDITSCTGLQTIYCQRNKLKSLDTSKNTMLGCLYCHTNDFTTLDVSGNLNLSTLNCSSCPSLKTIYLASGQSIASMTYDTDVAKIRYK